MEVFFLPPSKQRDEFARDKPRNVPVFIYLPAKLSWRLTKTGGTK